MNRIRLTLTIILAITLLIGLTSVAIADNTQGKFKVALADKESFVVTENDKEHTFQLSANAKILINDRESTLADLKAGDVVSVTWQDRNNRKEATMTVCRRE